MRADEGTMTGVGQWKYERESAGGRRTEVPEQRPGGNISLGRGRGVWVVTTHLLYCLRVPKNNFFIFRIVVTSIIDYQSKCASRSNKIIINTGLR